MLHYLEGLTDLYILISGVGIRVAGRILVFSPLNYTHFLLYFLHFCFWFCIIDSLTQVSSQVIEVVFYAVVSQYSYHDL
jgi:hypothetical protein